MLAHSLPRQKQVKFKVVKSPSRYSCTIHGSSKYGLKYEADTEVYALPHTIGVMCFTSYKKAKDFLNRHFYYWTNCMVIKVLPMGKGKIPEVIGGLAGGLDNYYNGNYDNRFMIPPDGTICYPAVYVVD